MASETKLCSNCKRDIATGNFVMHEMHCRRHVVLCEHCGEPVHRVEIEQHFNDLHAKIPCEKCQQMVPRPDMTKHLADDCTKKLMRCEFCEISLPKNDLESHLDYCGSRTECCPLCKQYIMQKDKLRHESSRCTFPEDLRVRPQPIDPFSMEDLQQFMTNAVLGNRNSTSSTFRKGKLPSNRKSNLNAQMAKNMLIPEVADVGLSSLPPDDVDYDSMLALQLAHEDWLQDGEIENAGGSWGYVSHNLEENSSGLNDFNSFLDDHSEQWSFLTPLQTSEPAVLGSHATQEDDENMSIPCEFCEEEVPLNFYIVHMDSCPLALERRDADLNNEQVPVQQNTSKAAIPVINNLRPSSPPPPEYHTASDDDDDVMLPCEFCQETFPSDLIIQHQSVCLADGLVTPRAATPTTTYRNVKPQQPSSQKSFKPSARSPPKQQQNASEVEFLSQEDSSELVNGDLNNFRMKKINESSSNKYSPAYNRFDEALTRPSRRPTRQRSLGSDEAHEPKIESRSNQRTRASLNQLLQEDTSTDAASFGNHRKELGILRSHDINKTDPRVRKTKVDSRIVAKRLEETKQRQAQESSGRTTLPQNGSNPTRSSQTSRNRQRADHVFSPELRLKQNNSPPPKKR